MEADNSTIERKLQGRTLQVYLYLQQKGGPGGIREMQRDLGMSSPSVAEYQVEKLAGMGLVSRDRYGRVVLARKVKVKALEQYVSLGRFSVPRLAFYASIFSAVAVLYAVFNAGNVSIYYGIAVPAAAAIILWAEAWKMWKFNLRAVAAAKKEHQQHESMLPLLVPGMVALVVFAAGAVFIFQYVQEPPAFVTDVLVQVPATQPDNNSSRPTIEESIEMSRQKVAAAGMGTITGWGDLATVISLGGAGVVAFMPYALLRHRSGGVLAPEQQCRAACGTQDYPGRMP